MPTRTCLDVARRHRRGAAFSLRKSFDNDAMRSGKRALLSLSPFMYPSPRGQRDRIVGEPIILRSLSQSIEHLDIARSRPAKPSLQRIREASVSLENDR